MSGSRTKTGCYTCRLRKKKCDEQKPICVNCHSRDILCYGYGAKPEWMLGMGSWKEIMESEEAKLVRESAELNYKMKRRGGGVKRKRGESEKIAGREEDDGRVTLIQEETAPFESLEAVEPRKGYTKGFTARNSQMDINNMAIDIRRHCHSPGPIRPSSAWDAISTLPSSHLTLRSDIRLLMTFLDVIFPLQYGFYHLSKTPDRYWLLQTLLESEPFFQASIGIAAAFESGVKKGTLTNGTSDLDPDVRRLQICALRGLQKRVDELDTEIYAGKELLRRGMQTLAIMTQLVSLEVFGFEEGQWEIHLQAARTILGMFQNKWAPELFAEKGIYSGGTLTPDQPSREDLKALEFFITSFIWIDIIANATFGIEGPLPCNSKKFDYLPLLRNGLLRTQQVMGCQSCVMAAITEITVFDTWKNDQMERGCLSMVELVTRAKELSDKFIPGVRALEERISLAATGLEADGEAVNILFAYAVLVYLHTIVSGPTPYVAEIRKYATLCLERFEALSPRLLIRTCWPFTVAGCMATEDQYGRFREVVAKTSAAGQALGTTWKGLRVMEECWRLRKAEPGEWNWRSTMKRMNVKILLI